MSKVARACYFVIGPTRETRDKTHIRDNKKQEVKITYYNFASNTTFNIKIALNNYQVSSIVLVKKK